MKRPTRDFCGAANFAHPPLLTRISAGSATLFAHADLDVVEHELPRALLLGCLLGSLGIPR